jgi:hypothetical protein
MSIHWRRDRFPLAVFADAEMFLTAFRTDRTGHLLLAAEIGGNPTRVDHRFDVTWSRSVAKAAIHVDWSSWLKGVNVLGPGGHLKIPRTGGVIFI